jgi:hypothetical protein
MKHETSLALYAYWQSCHRADAVSAGSLRAAELAPILPSLFLIEIGRKNPPLFRFCGAALAGRHGRDLTDESFLSLWNSDDRAAIERDLRLLANYGTGLVAGVLGETLSGGFTAFEMLLLPLAGDDGAAGAIGSMVRVGGHEEMNRIRARIVAQWLRSTRFLPPVRQGQRQPLADYRSMDAKRRRYGHLTVVTGGR